MGDRWGLWPVARGLLGKGDLCVLDGGYNECTLCCSCGIPWGGRRPGIPPLVTGTETGIDECELNCWKEKILLVMKTFISLICLLHNILIQSNITKKLGIWFQCIMAESAPNHNLNSIIVKSIYHFFSFFMHIWWVNLVEPDMNRVIWARGFQTK